jgi:hypothetical protein
MSTSESTPTHLPWATLCQSRLYPSVRDFRFLDENFWLRTVLWVSIGSMRILMQGFLEQNSHILQLKKFIFFKTCNIFIPRPQPTTSKLQEKPLALKKERPALKTKQFYLLLFLYESFLPTWTQIWIHIPNHVQIWIQLTKINANPC